MERAERVLRATDARGPRRRYIWRVGPSAGIVPRGTPEAALKYWIAIGAGLPLGAAIVALTMGLGAADLQPEPGDLLEWHGAGVWLAGDPHIHRMYRDSQRDKIVEAALEHGLDFIVSTDHAQELFGDGDEDEDIDLPSFKKLRRSYPGLIILAGIEWNVPASDHASVVVEEFPDEFAYLGRFARAFDRKAGTQLALRRPDEEGGTWGELSETVDGLRWLEGGEDAPETAVFLNHMSRYDYLTPEEIGELLQAGLAGIEAAPGHQRRRHPGEPGTIDRHEPSVVQVGHGYDWLLGEGLRVGLVAGSDFHIPGTAFWPGKFSRTLVYAPERSSAGIVRGLRAGATVTVLGGIVDRVETEARVPGTDELAGIAETLAVPRGSEVVYTVRLSVPGRDAIGGPNRVHTVEVISDCLGEAKVVKTFGPFTPGEPTVTYGLPVEATAEPGTCFLRTRGRRRIGLDDEHDRANADLMFHTSATFVRVH